MSRDVSTVAFERNLVKNVLPAIIRNKRKSKISFVAIFLTLITLPGLSFIYKEYYDHCSFNAVLESHDERR